MVVDVGHGHTIYIIPAWLKNSNKMPIACLFQTTLTYTNFGTYTDIILILTFFSNKLLIKTFTYKIVSYFPKSNSLIITLLFVIKTRPGDVV